MKKKWEKIRVFGIIMALLLQTAGCSVAQKDSGKPQASGSQQEKDGQGLGYGEDGEDGENKEADLAAQHLLEVWSDYLRFLDQMYGCELWALDYVDAYLESGDWADLAKARTSCIVSCNFLEGLAMEKEDLAEEEYLALSGAGVDTGYQAYEFSESKNLLEDAKNTVGGLLLEGLESGIFMENTVETLQELVSVKRDEVYSMRHYSCNETNYLLLTLEEYVDAKEYWASLQKDNPSLFAGHTEWLEEKKDLKAAADADLDAYEDVALKHSELFAKMHKELFDMQMMLGQGIEAYSMSNMPELLPEPEWYSPEEAEYISFIQSGDGKIRYPEPGDELADSGHGVWIRLDGVSLEEVADYIELAKGYAEDVWIEEEDSQTPYWHILMPDYDVDVGWEDSAATIIFNGADVTFAPLWYMM